MKACVYTYLFGSYDRLLPQPVAADSDLEFICFTDDAMLRSDTWEINVVEPRYPTDMVRSARYLKIVGDERLDEFDTTLCIDASVRLRRTPEEIIATWLTAEDQMALAHHSYREQVLDEFDEVVKLNYDDRDRVHEQLLSYSLDHADVLASRPLWTGMMVRRRTPAVEHAMRLWFDEVLRFSRRDQLSVNVALAESGLAHRVIDIDNFTSDLHEWPVIEGRRIARGKASAYASGPMIAELRRSHRQVADLEDQLHTVGVATVEELRSTLAGLHFQIERAEADRGRLEGQVDDLLRDAGRWQERWESSQGVIGASANLARAVKSAFRRPSKK